MLSARGFYRKDFFRCPVCRALQKANEIFLHLQQRSTGVAPLSAAALGGGAARRLRPAPASPGRGFLECVPPSPPEQHAAAPPSEVLRQVGHPPRSCPADLVAPGPAHQRVAARIDR